MTKSRKKSNALSASPLLKAGPETLVTCRCGATSEPSGDRFHAFMRPHFNTCGRPGERFNDVFTWSRDKNKSLSAV